MIRAYDDWGNVVDLVEYEAKIRADERAKQQIECADCARQICVADEDRIRADERNQWATHFEHILESTENRSRYEEGFDDGLSFVITELRGAKNE